MHFLIQLKLSTMKINSIMNTIKLLSIVLLLTTVTILSSCDDDDEPKKEDVPELITKATLTFTPVIGGSAVVATASDPDGDGVQDIQVDGPINLTANSSYV